MSVLAVLRTLLEQAVPLSHSEVRVRWERNVSQVQTAPIGALHLSARLCKGTPYNDTGSRSQLDRVEQDASDRGQLSTLEWAVSRGPGALPPTNVTHSVQ